jgi:hypothetical protein
MVAVARSRFYPLIAVSLAVFTIVGFSRTYYLRFLSDLPPMTMLVHLHGLVFTAWLAIFVAQTRLVAAHRVDLHMKLGIAGVLLAALVVLVTVATIAADSAVPRVRPSGLSPAQFTAVALTSTTLFAVFVALGIAFRRRAAWHKRFMVLAMVAVLGPPAARLLTLMGLREYSPYLVPLCAVLFIAWGLIHDWRRERIMHPVYVVGGFVILVSWPLRMMIARSEWYRPIGDWLAGIGAGL